MARSSLAGRMANAVTWTPSPLPQLWTRSSRRGLLFRVRHHVHTSHQCTRTRGRRNVCSHGPNCSYTDNGWRRFRAALMHPTAFPPVRSQKFPMRFWNSFAFSSGLPALAKENKAGKHLNLDALALTAPSPKGVSLPSWGRHCPASQCP